MDNLAKNLAERSTNAEGKKAVHIDQLSSMSDYLRQIWQDYKEYKHEEENAILFGRRMEMADIRNSTNLAMRVVPVT